MLSLQNDETCLQILDKLRSRKQTIAFAESLTAGYAIGSLARTSGISEVLRGGLVAYDIATKAKLLGVDAEHAKSVDAVSEQVARSMSKGARVLFGADFGVATTGFASQWKERKLEAYVAIARPNERCRIERLELDDLPDRDSRRLFVARRVLEMTLEELTPAN